MSRSWYSLSPARGFQRSFKCSQRHFKCSFNINGQLSFLQNGDGTGRTEEVSKRGKEDRGGGDTRWERERSIGERERGGLERDGVCKGREGNVEIEKDQR